jgi:hypothetical protein
VGCEGAVGWSSERDGAEGANWGGGGGAVSLVMLRLLVRGGALGVDLGRGG